MVNASLNWASIVGIVLAVGGAGLYFLRSFKPALARDYDVFFAAIGLLCGGILFFQGWRLDPILQFGQFLLAGTTVFFAYESVRLRGVATDQARRSSYFDEETQPSRMSPNGGSGGWDESYDRFDERPSFNRRFSGGDDMSPERTQEDFYRPRRSSRAAIPEEAASRRTRAFRSPDGSLGNDSEQARRMARFGRTQDDEINDRTNFGARRNFREDQRRGSRPSANEQTTFKRSSVVDQKDSRTSTRARDGSTRSSRGRSGVPQGAPIRSNAEDAAFSPSKPGASRGKGSSPRSSGDVTPSVSSERSSSRSSSRSARSRDNSSRFDN